jgi:ABC-type methionine transport system permease subunit
MTRSPIRPALVLALTWLLVSVVLTMLMAPALGARGLLWLAVQDGACLFGCSWEIRRAWRLQAALRGTSFEE